MFDKEMLKARIVPMPKEFELKEGKALCLKTSSKFSFTYPEGLEFAGKTAIEEIKKYFKEHCGPNAFEEAKGSVKISLEIKAAPKKVEIPEEGYQLELKDKSIKITAFGESGAYYAVMSLKQLIKWNIESAELPALKILDWPGYKLRGIKEETRYGSNLMELQDWYDMIDDLSSKKMNILGMTLYSCWDVQYDGRVSEFLYFSVKGHPELKTPMVIKYYSPKENKWVCEEKLPPIFEKDFLKDICAYAKAHAMKVLPCWNSYGHNTLVPAMIPEISAKNEKGEPELTGFCTQNEKTYEFLFGVYDQIIDEYMKPFGFDMIGVGLDEVWEGIAMNANDVFRKRSPWCKCDKCSKFEKGDLFIDHAIKLAEYLKKRGMKSVTICADMLTGKEKGSVGELGSKLLREAEKHGVKDVLTLDFWNYVDVQSKIKYDTFYPEFGMQRYYCPWNGYYVWALMFNPLANCRLLNDISERDGSDGCIAYSMYDKSCDRTHDAIAEYSWCKASAGTEQDITDRYIIRHFAKYFEEAKRAFKLLDLMSTQNDVPIYSHTRELLTQLAGYQPSYVRSTEPYPQPFIRYGLKFILAQKENSQQNRYTREMLLNSCSAMALEAKNIFEKIAKDNDCDKEMAERLAYECDNFLCICKDWLAVLEMYDLSLKGDFKSIIPIARKREKARLDLMLRLETTKDKYIVESLAMRIQSTFLISFRDIANYLEADEKHTIDFMSIKEKFISDEYRSLR